MLKSLACTVVLLICLAHVYSAVANYVRSFCHHRTLATLTTVGSLVHYVSVNIHCKCMCCKQWCVCLCWGFLCACVCGVCVCMCVCVVCVVCGVCVFVCAEVYDTMSCLPIVQTFSGWLSTLGTRYPTKLWYYIHKHKQYCCIKSLARNLCQH